MVEYTTIATDYTTSCCTVVTVEQNMVEFVQNVVYAMVAFFSLVGVLMLS